MTNPIGFVLALFFPGLLAAVIWWDVRQFRIPNMLTAALAGLFVVAVAAGQVPAGEFWGHLGAGVLAFLAGMAFYFRGWAGGGDAKLLAALMLWTGWTADSPRLILVMSLVGGVVSAVVWGTARWRLSKDSGTAGGSQANPGKAKVPYGVALAVAGVDFWFRRLVPALLS